MKKSALFLSFFLPLFYLGVFFLSSFSTLANTEEEISGKNDFSLSSHGGIFEKPTSFFITPKNQKKIYWSFFSQNPSNLHSTNEATRIFVPRSRNFWIFSDTSTVEKISFVIEKEQENRFFRIANIDANPTENFLPTITVENASPLNFSMKGWKISGKNFVLSLPDEELSAGEKRTFIVDISNLSEEILLTSPQQRVRDRVKVPILKNTEIYSREISGKKVSQKNTRKIQITRPPFFIHQK